MQLISDQSLALIIDDQIRLLPSIADGELMMRNTGILIQGEEIVEYYSSLRDFVIFTNRRIIACNVQGMTGSKRDYTSLPYSKMQAFSIESSGTFDMDSELTVCFSGLGEVRFDFTSNSDVRTINKLIATYVL